MVLVAVGANPGCARGPDVTYLSSSSRSMPRHFEGS